MFHGCEIWEDEKIEEGLMYGFTKDTFDKHIRPSEDWVEEDKSLFDKFYDKNKLTYMESNEYAKIAKDHTLAVFDKAVLNENLDSREYSVTQSIRKALKEAQ